MIPKLHQRDVRLTDVLMAARRFISLQSQADAFSQPADLAGAIERDFILFDLYEARCELTEAVRVAEAMGCPKNTYETVSVE